jgi:adenylylsulfate kinase
MQHEAETESMPPPKPDRLNGGGCVWLTGLSGAGKTTLAESIRHIALARGQRVQVLDGDAIRAQLSPDLGYSKADRDLHVLRVGFMSSLLAQHGVLVIASLISPFEDARERVRALHAAHGLPFYLVYLNATAAQCTQRDPKGLYAAARRELLQDFTGLTQRYEQPRRPELILETGCTPVEGCVSRLAEFLVAEGLL